MPSNAICSDYKRYSDMTSCQPSIFSFFFFFGFVVTKCDKYPYKILQALSTLKQVKQKCQVAHLGVNAVMISSLAQ